MNDDIDNIEIELAPLPKVLITLAAALSIAMTAVLYTSGLLWLSALSLFITIPLLVLFTMFVLADA